MPHAVGPVKSGVWYAEFRSKDSLVSLLVEWSWRRDVSGEANHGGSILDCTTRSTSETRTKPKSALLSNCQCFDTIKIFQESEEGDTGTTYKIPDTRSDDPALSFLWEQAVQHQAGRLMKFLLPPDDGYVVRSDLLEYSLRLCPLFAGVKGFVQPAQYVAVAQLEEGAEHTADGLLDLLHSSVGVAVANDDGDPQAVHTELKARLSWPWSVPNPVRHTRVAIIEESRKEVFCEEFYAAARACAVSVVILDEPGHWAEDNNGSGAKYREHFVPFVRSGCSPEELTTRVVGTISALPYKVDGIIAIYDMLMPAVARAAEILGLPTLGSSAYRRSTDKYETRRLSPVSTVLKIDSLNDLEPTLEALKTPLQYPLIIKPTRSHGGKGVQRVNKEEDLREGLRIAFDQQSREHELAGVSYVDSPVVVETYCDGPEVDVNMMLWNGEVLHAEVVDNFQCPGEAVTKSFGSFGSLNPSALPQKETDMLKHDIADIVRKLGLHSGVIHAEARVHNSSYEISDDGIGIRARSEPASGPSSTFLLEVNPRFAGWFEAVLSSYVYGIDYFAGYLMQAIGDEARFRSIACGFKHAPTYHYTWLPPQIETQGSGIMPEDLGLENLGIAESYATHRYYWKPGSPVPPKKERPWPGVGFMMLRSAIGADDAWRSWALARQNLKIRLDT